MPAGIAPPVHNAHPAGAYLISAQLAVHYCRCIRRLAQKIIPWSFHFSALPLIFPKPDSAHVTAFLIQSDTFDVMPRSITCTCRQWSVVPHWPQLDTFISMPVWPVQLAVVTTLILTQPFSSGSAIFLQNTHHADSSTIGKMSQLIHLNPC